MKKNYFSSKIQHEKKSGKTKFPLTNFRSIVGTMLLAGLPFSMAFGQTNPTPQPMPYTEGHFNSLTGNSPYNYPAGWQGWKLEGTINDAYNIPAISDIALQKGVNSSSIAGVFDMVGKLGFISNTGTRTAPVLAVKATDYRQISVTYDINVQRKVSDRVMGVQLQYRIGESGDFVPLEESTTVFNGADYATNNTGTDFVSGSTVTKTIQLPAETNHTDVLQLRWVTARLQGGTGDNLGFSIDNVSVNGATDPCANNPLPYTEDFSGLTALGECHIVENINNDSETWTLYNSSTTGFTLPLLRYKYHSSNVANDWFYTKGLALQAGVTYRLTYKFGTGSLDEKLKVAIGNMASSEAMNQVIYDHGTFRQSSPTTKDLTFTVPTSGNYFIGFHAYSAKNQYYIYLDDINVDVAPTCYEPNSLTIGNINHNSVDLSWTPHTSGTPSGYEYYYSTENIAPTAESPANGSSSTTSTTITGLSPQTTYNVWVRSVCGPEDKSVWSTSVSFTTSQVPTTFPYTDNFDTSSWILVNGTQTNKFYVGIPNTLTTVATSDDPVTHLTFADNKLFISNNGTDATFSNTATSVYAYRDIVLPSDITTAKLSFDWATIGEVGITSPNGTPYDYGRFYIVPTSVLPNSGVNAGFGAITNAIYELNNPTPTYPFAKLLARLRSNPYNGAFEQIADRYIDENVDLSRVAGQTVRLIFFWRNDGSTNPAPGLVVDNFSLTYPSSCVAPTEITSSNISGRTATISWEASTSEPSNGYEYYYSSSSANPTNETQPSGSTTNLTVNLAGLTPETAYNVWVRSVCSTNVYSSWSNAHRFTTAIACPVPTQSSTSNITATTADLSWTSPAQNFEYYLSNSNTAPTRETEGVAVTGNNVTVTGLAPLTTYYWWVRANCGEEDGKSAWTAINSFTTLQVPASFPYVDNFDTSNWVFVNGTQTNKFYIGTPQPADNVTYADNKLFVSNNGTTNTYGSSGSSVYAYRDITLPEDVTLAKISFDWILKGEHLSSTPYDYGRFYIVPTTTLPTAGTNLGYNQEITGAIYGLRNNPIPTGNEKNYLLYNPTATYEGAFEEIAHTYVDEAVNLTAYAGQTIRMIFFFRNDSSVYPPSLAIDNFEITYTENCIAPTDLATSNINATSATLSWGGNSSSYQYVVSTTNEAPTDDFVGTTNTSTSVIVDNLSPNTTYYWWVKSNCENTANQWVAGAAFTTTRLPQAFPFNDNFNGTNNWVLVNGTQTNKFVHGTPTNPLFTFEDDVLYISNNGTANSYNITSASSVYAYVDVEVPTEGAESIQLAFDWYNKGELLSTTYYDFGRVFVTPTTYTPTAGTAVAYNGSIAGQYYGSSPLQGSTGTGSTFNEAKNQFSANLDLSAQAGQTVRIVLYWKNDTSSGTQPPLAIDNFYFGTPRNLATSDVKKGNFVYYPNPVQNELNFKGDQTISTIEVYNLAGQAVNHAKVGQSTYTLDTTKLTAGVYMVKVMFENGSTKTVKIIKK